MVHEALELAGPYGVLELSYCFCLALSDAFACNFEDYSDFIQSICVDVAYSVSQFDNLAFAI